MARLVPALVIAVAFVVASMVTWRTSEALFTATTANGTDQWATGSVALNDNDNGTALFNVSNLKPGSTAAQCIRVTYTGTLASTVRVYGTGLSATNALDQYLNIQIEQGSNSSSTAGACGTFTNPVSIFNDTLDNFGTGFVSGSGAWAPASNPTVMDYRITYTLLGTAPNTTMSSNASVTFTWEAQNS